MKNLLLFTVILTSLLACHGQGYYSSMMGYNPMMSMMYNPMMSMMYNPMMSTMSGPMMYNYRARRISYIPGMGMGMGMGGMGMGGYGMMG